MEVLKKAFQSKMFKNYCFFMLTLTLIEVLFRVVSEMNIISWSFFRIFLGLNFLSVLFSLFLSFIPKIPRYIISTIIVLIFAFYGALQLAFNTFIGVYMSVNTSSQLGAVKDYIMDFLAAIEPKYYLLFIPVVIGIVLTILICRFDNEEFDKFALKSRLRYKNGIKITISGIILIVLGFIYADTLVNPKMQNELQAVSNTDLFRYPSIPSVAVQNFGIIGFGINDIKTIFVPIEENNDIYYASTIEEEITDKSRVFDDSLWVEVINRETDQNQNNINKFLINNRSTDKNEYTGLLEGKNIIVIMMESVGEIFINEEYFPNFYKMYYDGFHFINNYSPRNACATGNNEFSAITSLYSIYNNCTANVYKNNKYPESMIGLFKDSGYNTISMHDYTEAYYYRKTIHPNFGAMAYYGVENLGIPYQNEYANWASDEDFARVAMDIVLDSGEYSNAPFMLWMTTVSAHQPYSVDSITGRQYLSMFKDLPYNIEIKRYMSKLKILDNALGILMDRLDKKGELDNTVFVLFGDHYPYGISLDKLKTVLNYDLGDYENERTPLTIYAPGVEGKEFTQYTSYINIAPTVANLFDLDYDPRLYMGEDALSDNYDSKVVFADGSWKNDKIYYNAKTGDIKNYLDNEYTTERIISINQEINNKMNISSSIIKSDYFNKLYDKLAAVKQAAASELALNEEE